MSIFYKQFQSFLITQNMKYWLSFDIAMTIFLIDLNVSWIQKTERVTFYMSSVRKRDSVNKIYEIIEISYEMN